MVSAALGALLVVFRWAYANGYAKGGPKGRLIGAIGNDLVLLGLLGLSITSGVFFLQAKPQ